ncbi:hypothetical protein [Serratia proteamaculans]|uniref:hypothetical protein n=1 Tax=Serratia proteamaculans TaxID=28151 RepID=UPI0039B0634E
MNVYEMEGFLHGKCLPGDLRVNESNAEYLERKLSEVSELQGEVTALAATLEKCREASGCPASVDLQDWVKQLVKESLALRDAITTHSQSIHFCELCGKDDPCSNDDVCYALNETPATERIVAEAEARGVEKAINCIVQTITPNHETILKELAQQLREGDK